MPSVPHATTMTRTFPCLQVQIYEVEEHKIETWRGKNPAGAWSDVVTQVMEVGSGVVGLQERPGGPPLLALFLGRGVPAGLPQATGPHLSEQ